MKLKAGLSLKRINNINDSKTKGITWSETVRSLLMNIKSEVGPRPMGENWVAIDPWRALKKSLNL